MTSTEQALLAALWADPDDALLWSVYADWLEENGWHGLSQYIRKNGRLWCSITSTPVTTDLTAK